MAKIYSTPGVYIEEKSAFPNSVVAVATAVPAFIGYTEKAIQNKKDKTNQPVRISSFGEYLSFFGGPSKITYGINSVSGAARFQLSSDATEFVLFFAMKLFFANGGSDCYIVSVGNYQSTLNKDDFMGFDENKQPKGITSLLKFEEPTILVIPDAIRFERHICSSIQKEMLKHCGTDMRNRIAILDIHDGDKPRTRDANDVIDLFREGIGSNNLEFGAAYYPWLNTTITSKTTFSFENITVDELGTLSQILVDDTNESVQMNLLTFERGEKIKAEIAKITSFKPFLLLEQIQDVLNGLSQPQIGDLSSIGDLSRNELADKTAKLKPFEAILNALNEFTSNNGIVGKTLQELDRLEVSLPDSSKEIYTEFLITFKKERINLAAKINDVNFTGIEENVNQILKKFSEILKEKPSTKTLHQTLLAIHPLYKSIIEEVAENINLLPPSAGMAGIYTMVDNNRGVFQSPANVSIGSVIKPAVHINSNDQDDLNVPLNGKSVNAIRSFPGKGVLVWGARTLDGNSLDRRYISVRRTVIMIEQSVKNATEAYVFEPNTASTWSNLKAMLTNFLTNIWAQGALAGATPKDAFQVDIGLGVTMTPVDILEGILRITD